MLARIDEGCQQSAVGTRFEEVVRRAVMRNLGLDQRAGEKALYGEFDLES